MDTSAPGGGLGGGRRLAKATPTLTLNLIRLASVAIRLTPFPPIRSRLSVHALPPKRPRKSLRTPLLSLPPAPAHFASFLSQARLLRRKGAYHLPVLPHTSHLFPPSHTVPQSFPYCTSCTVQTPPKSLSSTVVPADSAPSNRVMFIPSRTRHLLHPPIREKRTSLQLGGDHHHPTNVSPPTFPPSISSAMYHAVPNISRGMHFWFAQSRDSECDDCQTPNWGKCVYLPWKDKRGEGG